jgi:cysteinyl-tRNA synthetase
VRQVLEWAKQEGRIQEASENTVEVAKSVELSDAKIEKLVAERQAARKAKNFARSDEIRNELASAGIILEDTKDGVRWKRK